MVETCAIMFAVNLRNLKDFDPVRHGELWTALECKFPYDCRRKNTIGKPFCVLLHFRLSRREIYCCEFWSHMKSFIQSRNSRNLQRMLENLNWKLTFQMKTFPLSRRFRRLCRNKNVSNTRLHFHLPRFVYIDYIFGFLKASLQI